MVVVDVIVVFVVVVVFLLVVVVMDVVVVRGVHPEIFRPKTRVCLVQVWPRSGQGPARSGEVWLRSLTNKK